LISIASSAAPHAFRKFRAVIMSILPLIVSQHAEEAAFLWLLRDAAVTAPHYVLWELAKLDHRVEAHLDGLRVAGEPGWEILRQQLDAKPGPGEAFVAALFAFESNLRQRIDQVLALAAPLPPLRRGVISALGWLSPEIAARHVQPLLQSADAGLRRLGLGGALTHRLNPGLALEKCLHDLDLSLRAFALRAVGIMGYAAWKPVLQRELRSPDLPCRFAAAWSLARFGAEAAALAELQTIALAESRLRLAAVNLAVRRLDISGARRLIHLLDRSPEAQRVAVFAAGALGDPAEIPLLLERMQQPALARLAGEAFTWMTGLDLAYADLEAKPPPGFESGPNEDPLDERVDLDPDEHLPWPDIAKLQAWWKKHQQDFRSGSRYLMGIPISSTALQEVWQKGSQRQRAAAALELGLLTPTQPVAEFRAPGFRQ
jgi:uncharacterized protein (TIGR02270 family)